MFVIRRPINNGSLYTWEVWLIFRGCMVSRDGMLSCINKISRFLMYPQRVVSVGKLENLYDWAKVSQKKEN